MLVYFGKNGVLKEQLKSYGNLPRVGSQYFKIFAYFENIDLTNYGAAYIRLQRPDISDSEYPVLFMTQADLTYDPNLISPAISNYFSTEGGPNSDGIYPCYLFDFSKITNDDLNNSIVTLLDTPGRWQATITLISSAAGFANVTGTIAFDVGGRTDLEEETEITFDIVTHNMATVLATKLNANSIYYVRSMDNFENAATNGNLPKSIFAYNGVSVWDSIKKCFYIIDSLTAKDDDYYYATYTKISFSGFDVPSQQATVSIIGSTLMNINGWVLSNYESTLVTINNYPGYKITRSGATLNESQAKTYMQAMTGSEFLPKYDFNKPQNSLFVTNDGEILKPQYDSVNGLVLYKMIKAVMPTDLQDYATTDYVDNLVGDIQSVLDTIDTGNGV